MESTGQYRCLWTLKGTSEVKWPYSVLCDGHDDWDSFPLKIWGVYGLTSSNSYTFQIPAEDNDHAHLAV
jgi:hypothetical protein